MPRQAKAKPSGDILQCPNCEVKAELGTRKLNDNFFKCTHFKGSNIIHQKFKVYNICKRCMRESCYLGDNFNKEKFKDLLKNVLNKPYIDKVYTGVVLSGKEILGEYMKQMAMNGYGDMTWEDSEFEGENAEKNINKKQSIENIEIELTESDLKAEKDVIRLLGYDPFSGYSESDKKFLYNELVPYLDEDTLEDAFKIGVVLQIINNNSQIRKIDYMINNLSSDMDTLLRNSSQIKELTEIKKKLVEQNDKLSKENNIALKHRGDKNSRNSTLGSMMKNLRELGFEEAEQDYYDMMKCHGMKISADISNKSVLDILKFDENDLDNMLKMQRDIIQQLQNSELELKEKIRTLSVENYELKEKLKK